MAQKRPSLTPEVANWAWEEAIAKSQAATSWQPGKREGGWEGGRDRIKMEIPRSSVVRLSKREPGGRGPGTTPSLPTSIPTCPCGQSIDRRQHRLRNTLDGEHEAGAACEHAFEILLVSLRVVHLVEVVSAAKGVARARQNHGADPLVGGEPVKDCLKLLKGGIVHGIRVSGPI